MALYLQDTAQKKERDSYSRLKEMVPRHVEQKIGDHSFSARNEDTSLQGAQACKGVLGGNLKGKGKETSKDCKH